MCTLGASARCGQVDNPEDLDRFYLTPAPGGGPGMHGLYLQCEADPAFVPFRSKSAHVRALTGGTCLMYQAQSPPPPPPPHIAPRAPRPSVSHI